MPASFLITGTDTGIGKTHAACTLLHALHARGERAAGMKPVASGCVQTHDGWRNADALALQASSVPVPPSYLDVNPYPLPLESAPQLAARDAGVEVSQRVLEAAFARLAKNADTVVVEGVGGWAAPLADGIEHAHLAQWLHADVILVVGLRLGCLNHARLSARAIIADGCRLRGWIGNQITADFTQVKAYLELLRAALPAPCLGVLPHGKCPMDTASALNLDAP